jgi:Tfp pilus assembly protein FimT
MKRVVRISGFTLIEALVAVTLLALLFGALMPVFQQGLSVLRSGDRHSRAVLIAQSILARELAMHAGSSEQAPAGEQQGEVDDFRWRLTRAAYQGVQNDEAPIDGPDNSSTGSSTASVDDSNSFDLIELGVVVNWPNNSAGVALHTLALEARPL